MGKPLTFTVGEKQSAGELGTKVTKDVLYGKVVKVVQKGEDPLARCYLMPTGEIVKTKAISSATVDPDGSPVDEIEVLRGDAKAELYPSSLKTPSIVTAVDISALAELQVDDVYALESCELEPGVYETTFNYRDGYNPRAAFIISGEPSWMLVGKKKNAPFIGKTVLYDFFDQASEEEESEDPMDFSMF